MTRLTVAQLNLFAQACLAHGGDEAKELAKEAMRRAAERADDE